FIEKADWLFRFVVKKLFLTWQTLLFQETLARTFVFGYCSVFKVLPAAAFRRLVYNSIPRYFCQHLFCNIFYIFA
ncbi:hypothetical protein L0P45_10640, partial [Phascolarctobacterium faecium]|uniref:hypothetical protein n=1 Tax=Phascolarctobacterium faecium TaxID=33025 RepID=UPI001EDF550C